MKSVIISGLVIMTMALTLAACGDSKTASQKAGEEVMEKVIEAQTGGKVNVDSNGETVTIKTEDGQTQYSANGGVKLPDSFPKELIVANDAKLMMASSSEGESSITYLTNDDQTTVAQKYISDLPGQGWKKEMEVDLGRGKMINFSKESEVAVITIGDNNSKDQEAKTLVNVVLTKEDK